MNNCKLRPGVTLVETLIGLFLISIIGLALQRMTSSALRTSAISEARGTLRQNAQIAMRQLERDIASSRVKAENPDAPPKDRKYIHTLEIPGGNTPICMEIPEETGDDETRLFDIDKEKDGKDYIKVTYSINNGALMRNDTKTTTRVANHIKSIIPGDYTSNSGIETTYDGKVTVRLTAAMVPDGVQKEIEHIEEAIIAIKQLQIKNLDGDESNRNRNWQQRLKDF